MTNKVIGIISYLPDDKELREVRKQRALRTIQDCGANFPSTPIIFIAQNWQNELPSMKNVAAYHFGKLGVLGARRKLREIFLSSEYDYLIMLDDDFNIRLPVGIRDEFLQMIEDYPDDYIWFNRFIFNLFGISKSIYSEVDFPDDIDPEKGLGFEDGWMYNYLLKKYGKSRYHYYDLQGMILENNDAVHDKYTTLPKEIFDYPKMRQNTIDSVRKHK